MADPIGYRNFLTKEKGIKDEDITYNNGSIYVKNKHFADATPQADGSTYGTREGINKAFNAYNNAGYQEDARNVLNQVQQRINTPPPQFNYNRATDPLYQDAMKSAQVNAQTAGNNATVRLGARGIGNSQQALTTENQIQQRELGQVERDIAPQLYAQAYKQYQDKYTMEQDQLKNLIGLGDSYNNMYKQGVDEQQQSFNNNRLTEGDTRQKRLDNMSIKQWYEQQYGVPIEAKEDWSLVADQVKGLKPLSMREYEDKRADTQFDQKYKTDTQNFSQWLDKQQLGVSQANSGLSSSNAGFNRMLDIWDRTGQAPAGLESMGIKPGTTLNDKAAVKEAEKVAAEKAKKMESEKTGLANALNSGDISYSDAEKSIQKDLAMGFYTSQEAAELNTLLKNWAAAAYGQRNN